MPAQRKYAEELRERAVKMVFEVRDPGGEGPGRACAGGAAAGCSPGGAADVGPAGGNGRVSGLAPRPEMGGGSRSWKGKCASSAGPMRD
jgi:hypothetical protein